MTIITLTNQVAGGVTDLRKTKSVVNAPAYYRADLQGCGLETHHYNSVSASFNRRNDCGNPLEQIMARSISGYQITQNQAAIYGGQVQAQIGVITPGGMYSTVMAYLTSALLSAADGINFQFDDVPPSINLGTLSWGLADRRGAVWVTTPTASGVKAEFQLVRLTPREDQCQNISTIVGSTSLVVTAPDADCVPRIVSQLSAKIAIKRTSADTVWSAGNLQLAPIGAYELATMETVAGGTNPVQATLAPLPFALDFGTV